MSDEKTVALPPAQALTVARRPRWLGSKRTLRRAIVPVVLLALWAIHGVSRNSRPESNLGADGGLMTSRPGVLKEIVAVDLPRPRDMTSDAFNRYRRDITRLIKVESRKVFASALG